MGPRYRVIYYHFLAAFDKSERAAVWGKMLFRIFVLLICSVILAAPGVCSAEKVKPMVGVYYFPGWHRTGGEKGVAPFDKSSDGSEWRGAIMKGAHPRAISGFYDDSNPKVWDYFNRWMTGHGIDFVAFDWYYNDGQEYLVDSLDGGFLPSNPDPKLKFCLHWCNHGGPWWLRKLDQSSDKLLKMVDLISEKYLKRPNYLCIDGKPVFMIYENDTLRGFGDVKSNLDAMRKRAKEDGLPGLYIVGVYSGANRAEIDQRKQCGYDAFCAYTYAWMRGPKVTWDSKTYDYADITSNIVSNVHPYLARVAKADGIPYWPTTFSGWDDRPRAGLEKGLVLLGNTPEQFGRMFRSALNHVDPACPVVMVEAWNEWGEGACVEPSRERGFGYLGEIAKALGINKPDERIPSEAEIASWNILTADELQTAKSNESKPWPVKPAKYYKMGKNRKVAPVKLPVTLDFASGGVEFGLNDIKVEKRDSTGLTFSTTGGDSQIALSTPEVPTNQIKRVTVEVEILTMPPGKSFVTTELYFTTALLPEFCPFACVAMPTITDGRTSQLTSEMMSWGSFGTPLTQLRLDPCGDVGARFRLKRIILSAE